MSRIISRKKKVEKEQEDNTVSVSRRFEGNEGVKSVDEFIEQICKEIDTKEIRVELSEEEKKAKNAK